MNQYIKHMKRFFVDAKNILTGNMQITNRLKFTAIIFSIAMVHFFLTIIFGGLKILPLFFFNICSVIIYVSGFCLIRRDIYLPVYYITYLEIILHGGTDHRRSKQKDKIDKKLIQDQRDQHGKKLLVRKHRTAKLAV